MSEEKLSVRLEKLAAKYGMAYEDAEIMEAAALLARRVEEGPVRGVLRDNANYLYIGAGTAGFTEGQRVRLVREA